MEKPTEYMGVKEIARRANVSIATVDRVIHNRTGVSKKTRTKIMAIIEELNYQPNILASRLASRKTLHLAILIPQSQETDFWAAPLKGIQRAESEIKQYGVQISPYHFDLSDKHSFAEQGKRILAAGVDGVLLAPSFLEEATQFSQDCQKNNIPFVYIDSTLPHQANLCYIGPPLYQSGYLGARLLTFGLARPGKVGVVNISKEVANYNYLPIEEGFRAFFREHQPEKEILRVDIGQTDYASVAAGLAVVLATHPDLAALFVTNSRVSTVATFLEATNRQHLLLIGYDFLPENVAHLRQGTIDFLICHQPEEQGYRGIMALYQSLVFSASIDKVHFMPIDIITEENHEFYRN
ncbi:LacI family DNA-binding transcriptional regulator [Rhabdobacter roseus]|uniref:LacI family transcriptional regulator n=1 Tax=Rhabdobacter roseus TaxID=1655419 RepID=A0A840TWX0_9BACT|nr:substrate-binding domain-containing protein [Rhabdobacter roseus]MBB5284139.1 LacI family transcriptional regulator [Rhabdobacter roseus]